MLSKYYSVITKKYGIKVGGVKELGDKSKYIVHYRNLQLHLSLRVKLVSPHRILKFNQSDWLKNEMILIQTKE